MVWRAARFLVESGFPRPHGGALAAGGSEFEKGYAELCEKFEREQAGITAGTFHAAGGSINYLVSARKPRAVVAKTT
jgi:hypothetical protein